MTQVKKVGRYEIESLLGEGAMGCVYKAVDPYIKRVVAIKTIKLDQSRSEEEAKEFFQRFFQEAQISGILNHPNIVSIYDVGEENGEPYIAMEYVEGKTLHHLIHEKPAPDLSHVARILVHIANALEFAHAKGIVHRDLKPGNIMVMSNGVAKIMDFGIAKMSGSNLTQTGVFLGTPSYSSPEQIREGHVDHRSDIFSFGILCHEVLTGHSPFPGSSISSILYKIANEPPATPPNIKKMPLETAGWQSVFEKVLHKDPDERYQHAADFIADLLKAMHLPERDEEKISCMIHHVEGGHREPFGIEKDIKRNEFEAASAPQDIPAPPPSKISGKKGRFLTVLILIIVVGSSFAVWDLGYLDPLLANYLPGAVKEEAVGEDDGDGQMEETDVQANALEEKRAKEAAADDNAGAPSTVITKSVQITSTPSGAEVFLGDASLGKTPLNYDLEGAPGETFSLRLTLQDHETQTADVVLGADMITELSFDMVNLPVERTITSRPEGAEVSINGDRIGRTPVSYEFSREKTYRIRFEKDGYFSKNLNYEEGQSPPDQLDASLQKVPPPGVLKIDTNFEDLKVKVDGRGYDGKSISLKEGDYKVRLEAASVFYREEHQVDIQSGETTVIRTPIVINLPKIDFIGGFVKVKIDGIYVRYKGEPDTTPLVDLPIAVGEHTFEFEDSSGKIVARKTLKVERSEPIIVAPDR